MDPPNQNWRYYENVRNTPAFAAIVTIIATIVLGAATWGFSTVTDMRRDVDRIAERQVTVLKTNQDQENEIRDLEKRIRNLEYWIRPDKDGRP